MPEWLPVADFVVKIIIASATAVLGLLAWLIARRQAQTASDKLKLDLFDRRYAVYVALTEWISDLQGRVVPDEDFAKHLRKIEPVQFLFAKEVTDWVLELRKKARAMNHARKLLEDARGSQPDDRRHDEIMEANKTYSTLTMEFDRELERTAPLLAPYLDFGKTL
jgi:hypothetical protein